MSVQKTGGPQRRIWARLCALALIAATLLMSAYAGGAPEPAAAQPRASANYSVKLSQTLPNHTVQLGVFPADAAEPASIGWNQGNTVTFEAWNVSATTTYIIRVIASGDYTLTPNQADLTVTVRNNRISSYAPRSNAIELKAAKTERPDIIETADTRSKGVNIQLLNYTQSKAEAFNPQFTFNGAGTNGAWNQWYNGQGVYQGILSPTIQADGFPKLGDGRNGTVNAGGRSLSYLFDPGSGVIDRAYTNLNNLFQYDEAAGSYTYNSAENFATVVPDPAQPGQYRFNVYDVPYQKEQNAPSDPKFLPFNDLVTRDGNTLDNSRDYHFGMSIDFKFLQPKGGLVNGSAMKFDFTGDDDVWLFIDGVLVLDMGGVHDAQTGSIDFSTGEISIHGRMEGQPGNGNAHAYHTSLREIMEKHQTQNWIAENFNEDGTFRDYTTHTFQYYYMERGGGGSNCKIQFNLPTIPDDTLYVQKKISYTNMPNFLDAKFDFCVTVQEVDRDGNPAVGGGGAPILTPYQGVYEIYQGEINASKAQLIRTGYTNDGTFTLQHGQYAKLAGAPGEPPDQTACTPIKTTSHFVVKETNAYSDHYEVTANEQTATWEGQDGKTGSYASDVLKVQTAPIVTFQNRVTAAVEEKLARLVIGKKLSNGASEEPFDVRIKIGGGLYAAQPYYILEADGSMGGEPFHTDENGIARLRAGQKICVLGIVWDTSFEVAEVHLNPNQYDDPTYDVTGDLQAAFTRTDSAAAGRFEKDGDQMEAAVIITNTLKTADFSILKVDSTSGAPLSGARFELVQADGQWNPVNPGAPIAQAETGADGRAAFTGVPFGRCLLYETKAPEGYKLPTDPVRVTVEAGMVTLMDVSGEQIGRIPLPTEGESTSRPDAAISNKKQDRLPVAGGMGTIWFTAGGLALIGAAALLYFKQRKKGQE